MIIIMRFSENVLHPKYIDIYEFWGVEGIHYPVDIHGPLYIFCSLFKKT